MPQYRLIGTAWLTLWSKSEITLANLLPPMLEGT